MNHYDEIDHEEHAAVDAERDRERAAEAAEADHPVDLRAGMGRVEYHPVPGHDVEVGLRGIYLGAKHGWKFGVRVLEVRVPAVKDDWRQIGSEVVYDDEAAAREAANAKWMELKVGDWRRSA